MVKAHVNKYNDYQKTLEKAWELFNCEIEINTPETIPKVILDSWGRSREFKVDARQPKAPNIITDCKLNMSLDKYAHLRRAALPVIKDARKVLDDNKLLMLLTSAEGVVIEREGNAKSLMLADSQQMVVGSNWSEKNCGTNAVGTALSIKRPVQIIAREHYCEMTNVWGCAAVPIKDLRDGKIIGVLDTTGPEHSFLSMNLGWVNSMASCIELRLNQEQNQKKFRLLEKAMSMIRQWQNDDALVFDEEGFLIWMSNETPSNNSLLPHSLKGKVAGSRVEAMSVQQIKHDEQPKDIDPSFLQPIIIDKKTFGYIFVVPAEQKKDSFSQPVSKTCGLAGGSSILGVSSTIERLRLVAGKFAKCNAIVTFTGETGTGKEVISKEVHLRSSKKGNFVAVNCGAIQKELLASELFGYAEGSFSGAKRGGMIGKFEAAQDGTILLDEFCELPLDLQVYLLRVLEEKEVVRIGEYKARPINARILVATNKDLEKEMEAGRLRKDLYYRVCANVINLPSLREHPEDILYLFDYFISNFAKENCGKAPTKSDEFSALLQLYGWPGNIRELRNFAENCFLMHAGEMLDTDHLPKKMQGDGTSNNALKVKGGALKTTEKEALKEALNLFNGNVSKAARHLGIARSTLYKKMDVLHITA